MKNIFQIIILPFFLHCSSAARLCLIILLWAGGFITTHAQQLKVTGGNLKVNNSSLVLQDMNFVNNGIFSSDAGNVQMTGDATTTISGTSETIFDTLSIAKTSGEVQLEQNIMVSGVLQLKSGNLDLQTSNLKMLDPSFITEADASAYVQTSDVGTLARPVADSDVTFPVGNSSYNPAILNNDGGTADFYTMRVRDELLEGGATGAQVTEYGVNRTWDIGEETASGSDLDVTLTWDDTDEIGTTGSDYVQANYNSGWNTVASGAAGSTFGLKSLTSMDNTNLGDYAIFEDRSPLTDSYICNENGALTVDFTISDLQNYHAGTILTADELIETTANVLFTAGIEVSMQQGFEVENGAYFHAFIANCNFSSINQVEQRGEEEENLLSTATLEKLQVKIFPNPFSSNTNIQFFLPESDAVQLIITDLNGKVIKVQDSNEIGEGWQQTNFDAGNLPSGNYILVVRSNGQQVVKSLMVQE